ncbi:MAG: hypothetical protein J5548_03950, partial [Prevotella sp.]|nr:hypothetical protein [Prevotella sp.]
FQNELNGSYLSTLATLPKDTPNGGAEGGANASCTTSLSFQCNPFKELSWLCFFKRSECKGKAICQTEQISN